MHDPPNGGGGGLGVRGEGEGVAAHNIRKILLQPTTRARRGETGAVEVRNAVKGCTIIECLLKIRFKSQLVNSPQRMQGALPHEISMRSNLLPVGSVFDPNVNTMIQETTKTH